MHPLDVDDRRLWGGEEPHRGAPCPRPAAGVEVGAAEGEQPREERKGAPDHIPEREDLPLVRVAGQLEVEPAPRPVGQARAGLGEDRIHRGGRSPGPPAPWRSAAAVGSPTPASRRIFPTVTASPRRMENPALRVNWSACP